MKSLLAFALGVIAALYAATYIAPPQTVETVTTIDVDDLRDTKAIHLNRDDLRDTKAINPDLDERIAYECTMAIEHDTGEPLAGIVFYVNRYWAQDACAALKHHLTHGWY